MRRIKLFAVIAIIATSGYFGYSAYEQYTMTDNERMMLYNLEALTEPEYPKNSDNIWDVTKEIVGGTDTYVKIICNTGGSYACPSVI